MTRTKFKKKPKRSYVLQDGTRPVSVSEIVNRNIGWGSAGLDFWQKKVDSEGGDPDAMRDAAAAFGTLCHDLIDADIDDVDADDLLLFLPRAQQLEARANLMAWRRWRELRKPRILAHEDPIVDEVFRIAGTPDLIAVLDGVVTVLDFKTGRVFAKHGVQLAGYGTLWQRKTGASMTLPAGMVLQIAGGELKEFPIPTEQMAQAYLAFGAASLLEQARRMVRFAD